ncbi:MAG: FAD-dependent monooxygenase [Ketobacteraceae bacterium]|nr:FAD-dependent monooxygenase [Ketobacteraceae bacterium]
MHSQRIAIIGAGIGGLSAALALTRAGFSVAVFEQSKVLQEVGAGIQLSPNATWILAEWGVLDQTKKAGFLPKAVKISHWRSGQPLGRFPLNHSDSFLNAPYIHIHRADIHQILHQAFRKASGSEVHLGARLEHIEYDADQRVTRLHIDRDGDVSEEEFDYVIGADGIHSKVREYVEPASEARFTGNVAWRGLVPVKDLSPSCRPDPCANLLMGPGAHVVYYYVRGGEAVNYVAVVETDQWQEESWTLKADVEEMLEDFVGWNAQTRDILAATNPDSCYRWALYDREPFQTWLRDQCVLLGDAAHPMLPFLAQGAGMAIEDAYALAACLEQHPDDLLKGTELYMVRRRDRTAKVQLQARRNMKLYHVRNPMVQFCRHQYLSFLGKSNPEHFNKSLAWLYEYRVKI